MNLINRYKLKIENRRIGKKGMGSLFVGAFELTISMEEYLRFYTRKGICFSYDKTHGFEFPVLILTIMDMLIGLYFALCLESMWACALAIILFHLFSISMMVTIISFVLSNYNNPLARAYFKYIDDPYFYLNIFIYLPILLIKPLLLYFYTQEIIRSLTFIPMNPVLLLIIWIIISLPLFLEYGTMFAVLYWTLFPLIVLLLTLSSPGYVIGRGTFSYYYITNEDLTKMYDGIYRERMKYEEIEEYNISSFLNSQNIPQMSEITTGNCKICLNSLNIGTKPIKLECNHIFHPECLKIWLSHKAKYCPSCGFKLIYHNRSYTPPKPRVKLDTKSWVSKLHYYPIVLSIKLHKLCTCSDPTKRVIYSHRKLIFQSYLMVNLIECICLPFISVFTQNKNISVLSNSLILAYLSEIIMYYFGILGGGQIFCKITPNYRDFWTDSNLEIMSTNDIISVNLMFQMFTLFIFALIALSFYLLITHLHLFSFVDYIFIGLISSKAFLDTITQLAPFQIMCLLFDIMYDLLVVFPITLLYMARQSKGISDLWLRI